MTYETRELWGKQFSREPCRAAEVELPYVPLLTSCVSSMQSHEVALQSNIPCRNFALSMRKNISVQSRVSSTLILPVGTRFCEGHF